MESNALQRPEMSEHLRRHDANTADNIKNYQILL